MFINISNHSSNNWGNDQKNAAEYYGEIKDIPFPAVDPLCNSSDVLSLAKDYEKRIIELLSRGKDKKSVVHVMGELTFCFALITLLQKQGIVCVASTTLREVVENKDGSRNVKFNFKQFREYPLVN